jgi:hypothetical protein
MSHCVLCEKRKPRRYCPGVRADICAPCCGEEREVTVDCPLDCEYLRDARLHEKAREVDAKEFPNLDIKITEEFLAANQELFLITAHFLLESVLSTQGAVDGDVREALEAMVRTQRTLESGLVYETRPSNPYAAEIQGRLQQRLAEFREKVAEDTGVHSIRDADLLGILAFLQRLEVRHNNGRRRGRAYIDFLRGYFPGAAQSAEAKVVEP